jgi:hypothetical protein
MDDFNWSLLYSIYYSVVHGYQFEELPVSILRIEVEFMSEYVETLESYLWRVLSSRI